MTTPFSVRRPPLAWAAAALGAVLVSLGSGGTDRAFHPDGASARADAASAFVDATGSAATSRAAFSAQAQPDTVSFADDVLPIFRARCAECHGAVDENGEVRTEVSLNLLEYERVIMGSEFGTVIEPGDPDGSFLLDMIVAGDMPEQGDPVPEEEIAVIRSWIAVGAPNN